jgi:TonB family protein
MTSVQVLRAHAAALVTIVAVSFSYSQEARYWPGYPESYVREIAITKTLPSYPEDAIQRRVTAVVQAKIGINEDGQVARIKIDPSVDAALKQAVADAVDKWTFKLRPELFIGGRLCLSRLTFSFSIVKGEPRVELYNPPRGAQDIEHLGYWDVFLERRQWNKWEEVQPTRNQP